MDPLEAGPDVRDSSAVKTAPGTGAARARSSAVPRPRAVGPALSPSPVKKRRRRNKRWLLLVFLLSAVTIGVAWWWYARSRPAGAESAPTTATVQRRDFF
jgi:ferric-dicitrate binding protein FerR (iron transport regulator)